MTLLKIARMGHPVLLAKAEPVPDPTAREIRELAENMVETMKDARGVGLAAPQVHVGKRVIVFYAPADRADGEDASDVSPLTVLVNPSWEPLEEEKAVGWEGCLSIPGLSGAVPRYKRIRYRGFTPRGQPIEREAANFHARVVQHECDHLDGVLFLMRMTDFRLIGFNEELRQYVMNPDAETPPE
jgi:peptide deformylase